MTRESLLDRVRRSILGAAALATLTTPIITGARAKSLPIEAMVVSTNTSKLVTSGAQPIQRLIIGEAK